MKSLKELLRELFPNFITDRIGFLVYRKQLFVQGTWPHWRSMRTLRKSVSNPETFSEKIRYKMAFDRNRILSVWADKVVVRDYVSATIGPEYLSNIFGIFQNPEDISLTSLPNNFVIKPNHASGAVIIIWEGAARQDSSYLESFMKDTWGKES